MNEPRWIDWAIVGLLGMIFLLIASGAAVASEPQVTLAPGTWQIVEFTNDENEQENLTITNISAPDVLLPYVVMSPASIPPLSSENITVQFAYVPISVRQSVPQDVFAVQVDGLLVYLDLSVPLPENAENRWAALETRIDAFGASFAEQMGDLAARITVLESAEQENWMPEIEALWENLYHFGDWMTSKIMDLWDAMPENSSPIDEEWFVRLADNRAEETRAAIASDIANMEIDKQLADAKAENERNLYISLAAIATAVGAVGFIIIRSRVAKINFKPSPKTLMTSAPIEDQIAMLENRISAMRERGEPDDAIHEKELALEALKAKLKPKPKKPSREKK